MAKIKEMLGSVRFWYCVIAAVVLFLDRTGILQDAVAKALELFAGLGIVIRQIESLSDKFSK